MWHIPSWFSIQIQHSLSELRVCVITISNPMNHIISSDKHARQASKKNPIFHSQQLSHPEEYHWKYFKLEHEKKGFVF